MDLGNITKVILLALLIVFVMHWRIIWCYGEYVYSGCLCGSMISLYNFLFSEFLNVANSIFLSFFFWLFLVNIIVWISKLENFPKNKLHWFL